MPLNKSRTPAFAPLARRIAAVEVCWEPRCCRRTLRVSKGCPAQMPTMPLIAPAQYSTHTKDSARSAAAQASTWLLWGVAVSVVAVLRRRKQALQSSHSHCSLVNIFSTCDEVLCGMANLQLAGPNAGLNSQKLCCLCHSLHDV